MGSGILKEPQQVSHLNSPSNFLTAAAVESKNITIMKSVFLNLSLSLSQTERQRQIFSLVSSMTPDKNNSKFQFGTYSVPYLQGRQETSSKKQRTILKTPHFKIQIK